GTSELAVQHVYTQYGTYTPRFYAVDGLGAVSAPVTLPITITPVALAEGTFFNYWAAGGTAGDDTFLVEPGTLPDRIKVTVNGVGRDNTALFGQPALVLYGLGGSDTYITNLAAPRSAFVRIEDSGAAGTDTLLVNGTADAESIFKATNPDGSLSVDSAA